MPLKIENPDGEGEIEVFTPAEVEEREAARAEAVAKEKDGIISTLGADLEKERKFHAEQKDNFKRLKDMTEDEKAKLTVEQIEARKIAESATEQVQTLKEQMAARDKADADAKKESLLRKYAGDDKVLREKLEAELPHIAIDDLDQKFAKAAIIAGATVGGINPLTQSFNGEAPSMPKEDDKKKFLESEKGKAALNILEQVDSKGYGV